MPVFPLLLGDICPPSIFFSNRVKYMKGLSNLDFLVLSPGFFDQLRYVTNKI